MAIFNHGKPHTPCAIAGIKTGNLRTKTWNILQLLNAECYLFFQPQVLVKKPQEETEPFKRNEEESLDSCPSTSTAESQLFKYVVLCQQPVLFA